MTNEVGQITTDSRIGGYQLGKLLGSGAHAKVYACRPVGDCSEEWPLVAKVYDEVSRSGKYIRNEIRIMNTVRRTAGCPEHICGYHGFTYELIGVNSTLAPVIIPCVFFDRYDLPLHRYLRRFTTVATLNDNADGRLIPSSVARFITRELFRGLALLHNCGITHADIKPENILLRMGENGEPVKCVITDLGSASVAGDTFSHNVGTAGYIAPEVLIRSDYTTSADVWSAMCVAYEVAVGGQLFDPYDDSGLDYGGAVCPINAGDSDGSACSSRSSGTSGGGHSHATDGSSNCSGSSGGSSDDTEDSAVNAMLDHYSLELMHRLIGQPPANYSTHYSPLPEVKTMSVAKFTRVNHGIPATWPALEKFIMAGLKWKPNQRITALAALENPWVADLETTVIGGTFTELISAIGGQK